MTHAKNKVDWCLKKAERELKEGRKHRGLVKSEPDIDEAKKHIKKAEHNLSAITYFDKGGFSDWSINASFYCIYHCFLAILSKYGYESQNQECTIALIKYLKEQKKIEIENIFIETLESEKEKIESRIIEEREFYTYGTTISVEDKEEIEKNTKLCKDCLDQTKRIIFS
ncbi:HEPN domain-containing protein [Candidatus Woesearchaeota archaeon]|nr:HEPN domain-containing protein [Candidatus Woesearchaeota archaeon]